ncbi:MAG: hypothetical protein RL404_1424 [Pseudomonadota bacterium]
MPKTAQAFFDFLARDAKPARQLYLLGDIFEYWAGDDDSADPFNRQVIDALRAVSDGGTRIFWIAGNRDFLAGEAFAQAAGLTRLAEPHTTVIAGQPVVLVHGDALCTDDQAYMAFRQQVRNPQWQAAFLARPLAERKAIIAGMREGSREAQRDKPMAIMDVNEGEVARLFRTSGVKTLIHGHTHRPASHETADGVRHVLPDWDCDHAENGQPRGGWLAITADGQLHRQTLG